MSYQPLICNQIFLTVEDVKALKWLYNEVLQQYPHQAKNIVYLDDLKPNHEITRILVYQVKSLLLSMEFSLKSQFFGYKNYLTKWFKEKEQYMQSMIS